MSIFARKSPLIYLALTVGLLCAWGVGLVDGSPGPGVVGREQPPVEVGRHPAEQGGSEDEAGRVIGFILAGPEDGEEKAEVGEVFALNVDPENPALLMTRQRDSFTS
jgi:hypothetical protein